MAKEKFKTYSECIQYLFNLERAGIKYDLRNIKSLLKLLQNPETSFKSIHIAGTNGKGSVSSIINSFLIEKKIRTGMYTSPHINDFRERILVNGKMISKKYIKDLLNKYYKDIERIKPSFFEVTTAMAFDYFRKMKADFAVIETGLGGRLDSTNVLKPVVSVITSISVDHVEFLSDKIEKIAFEKGGIIKKNIPVVIGNLNVIPEKVIRKIAREKHSMVIDSKKKSSVRITEKKETGFYFRSDNKSKSIFFPLAGDYQLHNIRTSLAVMDYLAEAEGVSATPQEIKKTFGNLKLNSNLRGRFELIHRDPKIIIDVSHNLQAIENIKSNLKYFKYDSLIIIFAMMQDKDFTGSVKEISKIKAKIILTKPDYKRAAEPGEIFKSLNGSRLKFLLAENVSEAFELAIKLATKKDLILVTGSFFLVSDFLKLPKVKRYINSVI